MNMMGARGHEAGLPRNDAVHIQGTDLCLIGKTQKKGIGKLERNVAI